MAIKSLTFDHDSDKFFTIATDEKGCRYRVLVACGGRSDDPAHYQLKPHAADNSITTYRGEWITAKHPLFPAIEAAEKIRRERVLALPATAEVTTRFAAEEI